MIPQTFHVYKSKEEMLCVTELMQNEYWKERYNALNRTLGIIIIPFVKKVEIQKTDVTFLPETEQYMKQLEDRLNKVIDVGKSCKIDGGCE